MECKKCGKVLPDSAAFCSKCGEKVIKETGILEKNASVNELVCPNCGKTFELDNVFCDECGFKLEVVSVKKSDNVTEHSSEEGQEQTIVKRNGAKLYELNMMSKYAGKPKVGIAKSSGTLTVYSGCLEFRRILGNSFLDPLGIGDRLKNKDRTEIYVLTDISKVYQGKYLGVMPTMIIEFKSGEIISFSGMHNSGDVENAIRILQKYL